ncbi:MAG: hypothetical protein ACYC8T_01075 [Myxococcaceae bacterium]
MRSLPVVLVLLLAAPALAEELLTAPVPMTLDPEPVVKAAPEPEAAPPPAPAPAPAAAPVSEKPKLLMLDLSAAGGLRQDVASALTDAVAEELSARGFFEVVSTKELATIIGVERQRQMLGCSEGTSCLTEIGGAVGSRFVTSGTLAQLGESFQLSLQTLDTVKAQPIGRSSRIARSVEELREQLAYVVAEATGTPLPAPPSRVLPYTLITVGALAAVGGGFSAFLANSQEDQLAKELAIGTGHEAVLKPLGFYQAEATRLEDQKNYSLGAAGAGVALVVLGLVLNPPATSGGGSVSLVPTRNGAALVGVLP